jgi:DNA repair exonuclease SbcCD nuclease subunit
VRDRVKFIHAADLHLDAPFQGLGAEDERVGQELAEATYVAWTRIVDEAIRREVDFVLVAGDLYNAADRSLRSQMRVREQAQRLDEAGIGLFVVHGNHDPLDGWSAGLELPASAIVFQGGSTQRAVAVEDGDFVCAVYGRSFGTRAEGSDFSAGYRREPADTVAIGLLHANVGNNTDYDPYAPCTLEALRAAGMDYWALGHIHKHEVLSTQPYAVYAGSPQGLNPRETGAHGCCAVSISRSGDVSFEFVELAPLAWASVEVDAEGVESLDRLEALVSGHLDDARDAACRPVLARVRVRGRAPVHADLARPAVLRDLADGLRASQLAREPWVWLDRLVDSTAPTIDFEALAESPEFSGEVARIAAELAADPSALESLVADLAEPVAGKLSGYSPGLDAEALLGRARDRALDLLLREGGGSR